MWLCVVGLMGDLPFEPGGSAQIVKQHGDEINRRISHETVMGCHMRDVCQRADHQKAEQRRGDIGTLHPGQTG